MTQIEHAPHDSFSNQGINGVAVSDAKTLRSQRIDSSLRARFADCLVRVKRGQTAPPICAAVIEFGAVDRLTFATREAQQMLGFALEPLWGQSLSTVLRRVPQLPSFIEWLTPAPQACSPTTRALGSVYGWLRLGISEASVLTICFRDERSP